MITTMLMNERRDEATIESFQLTDRQVDASLQEERVPEEELLRRPRRRAKPKEEHLSYSEGYFVTTNVSNRIRLSRRNDVYRYSMENESVAWHWRSSSPLDVLSSIDDDFSR